jgi:hypothetical protein
MLQWRVGVKIAWSWICKSRLHCIFHTRSQWNSGNAGGFTSFITGHCMLVYCVLCWFVTDRGRTLSEEMWTLPVPDFASYRRIEGRDIKLHALCISTLNGDEWSYPYNHGLWADGQLSSPDVIVKTVPEVEPRSRHLVAFDRHTSFRRVKVEGL